MPQVHAVVQRLPEPDEDRQLDQGRQAASQRVDPVLLVEGHGLPALLLLVVLVFLLDLLEQGLEVLHLLGGHRLLAAEREHEHADQQRQQDDRDAVIALRAAEDARDPRGQAVDAVEQRRDDGGHLGRVRDAEPPALAIRGQLDGPEGRQRVGRLGAGEDAVGVDLGPVRPDRDRLRRDLDPDVGLLGDLGVGGMDHDPDRLAIPARLGRLGRRVGLDEDGEILVLDARDTSAAAR